MENGMGNGFVIRALRAADAPALEAAFAAQGWNKPAAQFERYLAEQCAGKRRVAVAELDGEPVGYGTLLPRATAGPFVDRDWPEISDFNVLERCQRRGIGTKILDALEAMAAETSGTVTLGVGLHAGYGAAQRMYVLRGYVPDGSGVWYRDRPHVPYEPCVNDDDLILYLSRRLSESTLYVSDLDGTLLDEASKLPPETTERLNRLIDRGLPFTIATARSWSSASAILKALRLKLPAVTYNGAFLVDPADGRILESDTLSFEQVAHARRNFEGHGASVLVYAFLDGRERVSWLGERENEGTRYYVDMRRGDDRLRRVETEDELYAGDIFYLTAIGTPAELEPLLPCFPESLGFSMTWQQELYREEYWLEVKRHDATKAHGVEKLKERTGFDRIVCFGDGVNDLPMFRIADLALAVENGSPLLLAEADALIAPSVRGGVPEWLERNWPGAWKTE